MGKTTGLMAGIESSGGVGLVGGVTGILAAAGLGVLTGPVVG